MKGSRTAPPLCLVALVGLLSVTAASGSWAQQVCRLETPPASLTIPHRPGAGSLTADPAAPVWARAATGQVYHDCTRALDYRDLSTEVRAFWTDSAVYFLF